jgi:hypothetical protein
MPKIVRVGDFKDYTLVENSCLRDKELDIPERGLLVTMLSLPDSWDFSGIVLTSILPCGKSKVFTSLKKLENAGYLKRKRVYVNGRVTDWEYHICGKAIFKDENTEDKQTEDKGNADEKQPDELSTDDVDNHQISVDKYVDNSPQDTDFLLSKNLLPENQEVVNQQIENRYDNKINKNQKSNNQICIDKKSINQSYTDKMIDGLNEYHTYTHIESETGEYERYKEIIKDNINFDELCRYAKYSEPEFYTEVLEIMTEIVAFNHTPIRISGNDVPAEIVKKRFLEIRSDDIEYVKESFFSNTAKIKNIRSYLISMIFNSRYTKNSYYTAEVRHDMYGW